MGLSAMSTTNNYDETNSGPPPLKQITEEKLEEIIKWHEEWLKSEGTKGIKANFSYADLKKKDLKGNLSHAIFRNANLENTNFREADLSYADLTNATNLLPEQLAHSVLSCTKLPNYINIYDNLKQVEDSSKFAGKIFLFMLLGCLYSFIIIFTVTDAAIITDSPSSPLPIFGTAVRFDVIFKWAPFFLLSLFAYFRIYLQRSWEKLSILPSVFPNGRTVNEMVHPWILNISVRRLFKQLKKRFQFLYWLQSIITFFLQWLIVPLVLLLFWLRYLPRHDEIWYILHVSCLSISVALVIVFWIASRVIFKGWSRRISKFTVITIEISVFVIISALNICILHCPLRGNIFSKSPDAFELSTDLISKAIWTLGRKPFSDFLRISPYADISREDISIKPANWEGSYSQIELVREARLMGRDLRFADAAGTFFVRADLTDVDFGGAHLEKADFRGAKLIDANFVSAWTMGIKLREADLTKAKLIGTNLDNVDLTDAILIAANLQGASVNNSVLINTNLQEANLLRSKLSGADFTGAIIKLANFQEADIDPKEGLSVNMIKRTKNWILAYYNDELIDSLNLYINHNDLIRAKDLSIYPNLKGCNNLQSAYLDYFNLRTINFENVNLKNVDIFCADLRETTGLTIEMIKQTKNWKIAFFDDDIIEKLDLPNEHNLNIREKNLKGYDLSDCDFRNKDLSEFKKLAYDQIKMIIDKNTILPDYIKPPKN